MRAANQAIAARGRWAIAAIFLVNGFLIGSWAPQIPVFLTRLDISEFTLGLLILLFGAGAVSAMTWCGHLISRHGSKSSPACLPFWLLRSAGRCAGAQCAARRHRHVHLRRLDRRHGRRHERQCRDGREDAVPRHHVVLARLLEPRRLRRRRARRLRHPELRSPCPRCAGHCSGVRPGGGFASPPGRRRSRTPRSTRSSSCRAALQSTWSD